MIKHFLGILFISLLITKAAAQKVIVSGYKDKNTTAIELETKYKGKWITSEAGRLEFSPQVLIMLDELNKYSVKAKQSEVKQKNSKVLLSMHSHRDLLTVTPNFKGFKKLVVKLKLENPVIEEGCDVLSLKLEPESKLTPPFFIAIQCNQNGNDLQYHLSVSKEVMWPRSNSFQYDFSQVKPVEINGQKVPPPEHVIRKFEFKYKGKTYPYRFVFKDSEVEEAITKQKEKEAKEKVAEQIEEENRTKTDTLVGFGNASFVIEGDTQRISDEPLNFFIYHTRKKSLWSFNLGFQYWNGLTSSGGLYDVSYKDLKLFMGYVLTEGWYSAEIRAYGVITSIAEEALVDDLSHSDAGVALFQTIKLGSHLIDVEYLSSFKHDNLVVIYTYDFKDSGFDVGALWAIQNFKQQSSNGFEYSFTQNMLNIFMRF